MKNKKGLIQIPIIIGLVAVGIAIPVIRSLMAKKVAPVEQQAVTVQAESPIEASIKIEPENYAVTVGGQKKLKLIVDTSVSQRKVDIARVALCWSGGLKIADYEKDITFDAKFFSGFIFKKPTKVQGQDCVDLVVNAQWKTADLKSGKLTLAEINFTGTEKLSGFFSFDKSLTEVSGPANERGEYGIRFEASEKINYQVN